MSRAIADPLADRLLRVYPADQAYAPSDWADAPMPASLRQFLRHRLRQQKAQEVHHLWKAHSDWVRRNHPAVQHAQQEYLKAIEPYFCVPPQEWEHTLRQAAQYVTAYLVRPRPVLMAFFFGNGTTCSADRVRARLPYFGPYAYFHDAVEAFLEKQGDGTIARSDLEPFVERVDVQMTRDYTAEQWLDLLAPLFSLARVATDRAALPVSLLRRFFEQKNATWCIENIDAQRQDKTQRRTEWLSARRLRTLLAAAETTRPSVPTSEIAPDLPDLSVEDVPPAPPPPETPADDPSEHASASAAMTHDSPTAEPSAASDEPDAPDEYREPDEQDHVDGADDGAQREAPPPAEDAPAPEKPSPAPPPAPMAPSARNAEENTAPASAEETTPSDQDASGETSSHDEDAPSEWPPASYAKHWPGQDNRSNDADSSEDEPTNTSSEAAASDPRHAPTTDASQSDATSEANQGAPTSDAASAAPQSKSKTAPPDGADTPLWKQFQDAPDDDEPEAAPDPSDENDTPLWARFQSTEDEAEASDDATADERRAEAAPDTPEAPSHRHTPEASKTSETSETSAVPDSSATASDLSRLEADVLGASAADQRHEYIQQLFEGSTEDYREVLTLLRNTDTWTEASRIIAREVFRRHQVNIYSEVAVHFTDTVEARFRTDR